MKAKFHRILVAIARHKSASDVFHQALVLAQQNHSHLILTHCTRLQVLSQVGTLIDSSFGLVNPAKKQQLEREHQVQSDQAAQWLRTYALEAQARGVCTEAVHQLGEPSIQICHLARQFNARFDCHRTQP